MKINITGACHFVNRMFEACGSYQWAREFLKNSLEANGTRVEFGIEWQAVEKLGVYRRTIMDNAEGMDSEELIRFFSILGEGSKRIGGIHENFGVGAKIAALPWNPNGLVVISYKQGRGAMIWIVSDPDSGEYELVEFDSDGQRTCAVVPTLIDRIDWGAIRPPWIKANGTIVVLLGAHDHPDTVTGNLEGGESDIKGLSVYLNTRFWDLSNVDVTVVELRSERKTQWPRFASERDDSRRPNNRKIMGPRYFLTAVKGNRTPGGKLKAMGTLAMEESRVSAEWYLWEGERPAIHSYAKKTGYIAIRYIGELYQLTSNKAHFRWFGITESAVQQNLTIILEPQLYQPHDHPWGIYPDQSRNRLLFTGSGEKGVEIPLSDWGLKFAENMPQEILAAIREARTGNAGSIEDEEYRKRLQGKFGTRWSMKVLVHPRNRVVGDGRGSLTSENQQAYDTPCAQNRTRKSRRRRSAKVVHVLPRATPNGRASVIERDAPVDVPKYRMAHADEFQQPWHVATWVPNDPEGPTVLINIESPVLEEVIEYHQRQYPHLHGEQISQIVCQVFGEVAACKIAHSQKLARQVPQEELDRDYRNEQALTVALMGLLAEESLIAQRLSRLGLRRMAVNSKPQSVERA